MIFAHFRTNTASVTSLQDLQVSLADGIAVVAQFTKYEVKSKASGDVVKQTSTTLVRVKETSDGLKITGLWEVAV